MTESRLDTVRRMAQLARLALSEEELAALAPQLERILAAFQLLARFPARGPAHDLTPPQGRVREDAPRPSPPPEPMLAQAPEAEDGFFAVPKTVGGER